MSDNGKNIDKVKSILAHSIEHAKPMLKQLHPSDIAKILEEVSPAARKVIIGLLPVETASEALTEMADEFRPEEILLSMSHERAAEIIEELDPDDAADLLSEIPSEELRLILERISDKQDKETIEALMTYDEESAGGIMNPDVLVVSADMSKREAMDEVIRISEEMEDFYAIYVVDEKENLIGVVPLKSLIQARPWVKMRDIAEENIVKVHVDDDQEEVARKIQKYNLPAIPVVDANNKLLGRITFDDIMDVLEDESTEDILKIAGVSEYEELSGAWYKAVKSRIPWLLINLFTASLAGFVISRFSGTIDKIVIIASFMPIVAGVAGNSATQALAVTIRRIATDGISSKQYFPVIMKELSVGLMNGLLLGLVVGAVAFGIGAQPLLGVVVFGAMVGNLLIAGFAGSAIPLLLQRMKVDPAVASSILMTAFTDILGYTLLLGLATLLLDL